MPFIPAMKGGAGGDITETIIYGFHIDGNESDPASAITYLADAIGNTPAYMDFVNDKFEWGSWENAFFIPKPCMLKYDGSVDYYLDPNDYTKKEDGTASDIADISYGGNAMVEWSQIWYKIVPDSGSTKSASIYIANKQVDDSYVAWSFYNSRGFIGKHFYTHIFKGSLDSNNRLRSISGQALMLSKTADAEMSYAKANNSGSAVMWLTDTFADWQLITFLLILMGKSLNTTSVFGRGIDTGEETTCTSYRTGALNDKGLFYGKNDRTTSVKVFGIENWYALQWNRIAGWINANGIQKIKLTYSQSDGSGVVDFNTTGNGYISVGATPSGTSGGYISEMLFDKNCMVPKTASGSDNTYYCDGLWFNNSQVDYARVGGSSIDGLLCGAFYSILSAAASVATWAVGASVSCRPL